MLSLLKKQAHLCMCMHVLHLRAVNVSVPLVLNSALHVENITLQHLRSNLQVQDFNRYKLQVVVWCELHVITQVTSRQS